MIEQPRLKNPAIPRQILKKACAITGAAAMCLVGLAGTGASAYAENAQRGAIGPQLVAESGEGRYRQSIDWMEWANTPDQTITSATTVWSTPHDAGNNQSIATQCVVTPQGQGSALETYRTGEFYGDALTQMYNVGTNNIVGVANRDDGNSPTFDYTCKEYLMSSSEASSLGASTPTAGMTNIPLEGLVFADAESNNYTWYQQETITAKPNDPQDHPSWRLLDSYRTPGCNTSSLASVDANGNMIFRSDGGQCANDSGSSKGPASVMFLQGSESSTVTVKGGGRTAVALGVMPSLDFGDAPASYGVASASFGPNWTGGKLGVDNLPSKVIDGTTWYNLSEAREEGANPGTNVANDKGFLAKMDQPIPRLGATEDSETSNKTSDWADGDDTTGASQGGHGDEDGVAMSPDVNSNDVVKIKGAVAGRAYSQAVTCAGGGKVRGWIDWDRNGTFDDDEASAQTTCPAGGNASLSFAVPNDVKRSVAGDDEGHPTFMRVRISKQPGTLAPTGFIADGEVEDYQAAVMIPQISVIANLPSKTHSGGRLDPSDQFDVTLKDGTGASVASTTTTGTTGGAQADTAISGKSVTPGQSYTVGSSLQAGSATTDETNYESQIDCRDISQPNSPKVAVDANGQLTIPANDDDANVQCMVTRVPFDESNHAKLTVSTVVRNTYGQPANPSDFNRDVTPASGTAVPYGNGILNVVDRGDYTVSGNTVNGYTAPEYACTDNGTAMTFSDPLNLQDGHTYDCTISYEGQPGSVSWTKTDSATGNLLGGSTWLLKDEEQNSVTVRDCTSAGSCSTDRYQDTDPTPGKFNVTGLDWGTGYKLSEVNPPAHYAPSPDVKTFDIMAGTTPVLNQDLGAIANTQALGKLTIKRKVIDGNAQESEFAPSLKDTGGNNVAYTPDTAKTVDSDKYVIGAGTMASGYKLADSEPIHCTSTDNTGGWDLNPSDASYDPNTVSVFDGGDVTCTVPYETIKPTLKVVTVVNNTHGGTAGPTDFDRTVVGSDDTKVEYNQNQTSNVTDGVSYKVEGSTKAGYSKPVVTYESVDKNGNHIADLTATATDAGVAAANGQNVVATVTYNDEPAKVTVTTVIPAGSDLNADSLGRTVTGPAASDTATYTNGETKDNLNAGNYKADGENVPGYIKTVTYKLDGEDVPASHITENGVNVGVGQHLEAMVTYVQAGKLTVKTEVQGGTANPDDLGRTVTYPDGSTHTFTNGESQDIVPGSYKVKGADAPTGYSDPTYKYTLADGTELPEEQASVAIAGGQDVTATIVYKAKSTLAVNVSGDFKYGGTDAGSGSNVTVKHDATSVDVPVGASTPTTVDSGTYSVTQLLNAGYKMDGIIVTDTTTGQPITVAADGTFKVEPGHNVKVDIKNVDAPGTIDWQRFDKDGKTLLSGSKWQLNGPDGEKLDVEDCTALACTGLDKDPTPGKFSVTDLRWGNWTITETKAPAGHRLSEPLTVNLGPATTLHAHGVFQDGKSGVPTQPDKPAPGLSQTGAAIAAIAIAAAVLALIAIGIVALRRHKQ